MPSNVPRITVEIDFDESAVGFQTYSVSLVNEAFRNDIAQARTFGFASRNFYVAFLAASRIDRNRERYFPGLVLDDPVDYALWKVQRHSGVTVTATERQRRYPLIFAWPLVWQLYRQGALK